MPYEKGKIKYPIGYNDLEHFIKSYLFVDEKIAEKDEEKVTYLCLAINDGVNYKIILGDLDRVKKLTKEKMIAYCTPYEKKREKITDEARVKRLAIKAQLGIPFTEEENKAIDPEDDTPGFGLSKRFVDLIQ